jgi:ribosomal protein RSM22 (predicted rRNA methylase)
MTPTSFVLSPGLATISPNRFIQSPHTTDCGRWFGTDRSTVVAANQTRTDTNQTYGEYNDSKKAPLVSYGSFTGNADMDSGGSYEDDVSVEDYDYDDDDDDGSDNDDDDDDEASYQPWKDLLEIPGRAAWRVSDSYPPDHLMKAMYNILDDGDRTPKQLRRAHRKVLSIHDNLARLRERERRRMVNGNRTRPSDVGSSSTNRNSSSTIPGFVLDEEDEADSFHPVYYGFDETLATLKHRLVPNYAITKRVLSECQSLMGGPKLSTWNPKRIVDFGIGCGSATAAAIDLFGSEEGTTVEWVHGIDPSLPMRECSRRLIEEMVRNRGTSTTAPPRVTFSNSLSQSSNADDDSISTNGGAFDLALFTYTATDLKDVTSCLAAAALLFEKLKPDGVLVMIEPGTPDGFNSIRAVRNMLLDCCPPDDPEFEWADRCQILAPCTHNGRCPMERHKRNFFQRGKLGHDLPQETEGDTAEIEPYAKIWDENEKDDQFAIELSSKHGLMSETEAFNSSFCSFVHYVPGDSAERGDKFSYLVAQKKRFSETHEASLENDAFQGDDLTDLLSRAFDAAAQQSDDLALQTFEQAKELRSRYLESEEDELGFELIRGAEKRSSMGRIIRAPIKKKGHVYIDYCTSPGRIVRSRVTKAMSNNIAPGIFGAARKSRWGGLWPDTMDRIFSLKKQ